MEPEEVLEQQEQVETPVEEPVETPEPETPAENVQEEPEPEPEEAPVHVAIPRPEIIVRTGGFWKDFEEVTGRNLEDGKTYNIAFGAKCEVMIAAEKPTVGITTNEIVYTKQEGLKLWIKTGV